MKYAKDRLYSQLRSSCFVYRNASFLVPRTKCQKNIFLNFLAFSTGRKSSKIKKNKFFKKTFKTFKTKCQKKYFWHLVRGTKNEALRYLVIKK